MMTGTYDPGETKIRPGVYRRYTTPEKKTVAEAINGVFAIPIQADFGPVGTVQVHTKAETVEDMYGSGGTVKGVLNLFDNGASKVYVYRLGAEGTKGILELMDDQGEKAVTLETKYPTKLVFSLTLKQPLSSSSKKEVTIYQGSSLKEKFTYETGSDENEVDAFIREINQKSSVFTAVKADGEKNSLAQVSQKESTAGTNPTVVTGNYEEAFGAFEAYTWNALVADTTDTAVHALLKAYMQRMKSNGCVGICVVGESAEVDFAERMSHAKEFNSEAFVYVGSGFVNKNGEKIDGYEAITVIAGIIGSCPANQSIVHSVIADAVEPLEILSKEKYIQAIENGMLMLSQGPEGEVWFDSGINTLNVLEENQDAGWKKIRRTKTRFELFDRLHRTISPVIGKINCDSDGIANVIKLAKDVLDAMTREGKLMDGADIYEDPQEPHGPEDVHFIVAATDLDSLEKVYLNYQFNFSAEA